MDHPVATVGGPPSSTLEATECLRDGGAFAAISSFGDISAIS
jgi:hypothetical protein